MRPSLLTILIAIVAVSIAHRLAAQGDATSPEQKKAEQQQEEKPKRGGGLFDLTLGELLNIRLVTVASGFRETNTEAASTVEVINAERWRKSGSRTMWDALNQLPGTSVMQGATGMEALTYRGIAVSPGARGTAMMIDGVPVNDLLFSTGFYQASRIGLGALGRIEMIRGPGSALYGADAFQGVLDLHTKSIDEDLNEFEMSAGVDDYYHGTASFAQSMNDEISVGITLDYSESDPNETYLYGSSGGPLGLPLDSKADIGMPRDDQTLTAKFKMESSDRLTIEGSVMLNEMDRSMRWYGDVMPWFLHSDSTFALGQVAFNYSISDDLRIEGQFYYWQGKYDWGFTRHDLATNVDTVFASFNVRQHRVGLDLRLKGESYRDGIRWQVGYSPSRSQLDRFDVNSTQQTTEGNKRDLNSVFAEIRIPVIDDELHIIAGGRIDHYSDFGTQSSPRLGFVYQASQSSSFKLLYGNAFRAPAIAEIASNPPPGTQRTYGDPNIDPEVIDTYELVYMKSWEDHYVDLVLFYNELSDGILLVPMPTSDPRFVAGNNDQIYVNASESESYGLEVNGGFQSNGLRVDANVSYAVGKNASEGYRYSGYPTWMANLMLGYEWESQRTQLTLVNRVALDRTTFQTTSGGQAVTNLGSYYRLDMNLTSRVSDDTEITLQVLNLLDDDELYDGSVGSRESRLPEQRISGWLTMRINF